MLANVVARQIACVGFLQKAKTGIVSQAEIHLAIASVDRNHLGGAMLQHAVAESAGRGADVKAHFAVEIDLPVLQSFFKFQAASADITEIVAKQSEGAAESMDAPAFSIFCSLTRTFPARMSACARSREGVRPRSTSNLSRRVFNGPLDNHSPQIRNLDLESASTVSIRRDAVSTPYSADCRSDSLTKGYKGKTGLFHKLFHECVENFSRGCRNQYLITSKRVPGHKKSRPCAGGLQNRIAESEKNAAENYPATSSSVF